MFAIARNVLVLYSSGRVTMDEIEDGIIQTSCLLIKNEYPICLRPISMWSIGRYQSINQSISFKYNEHKQFSKKYSEMIYEVHASRHNQS